MENLIKKISYNDGHFPRKELEDIIARKEEAIPELLNIVQEMKDDYQSLRGKQNYMSHIYAFYLLAQFRVKEFYPIFTDILKLPNEVLDELLGGFITEGVGQVLATICDDEIRPIKELIENGELDEYVRGQAVVSLVILVCNNRLRREDVLEYYRSLLKEGMADPSPYLMAEIICCCDSLYPDELYEDIKQTYENNLVESWIINLKDIDRTLSRSKEAVLTSSANYGRFKMVENTIEELENWACFYKDRAQRGKSGLNKIKSLSKMNKFRSTNQPIVNQVKIGRNDPCSCGSGKKYKKCCG